MTRILLSAGANPNIGDHHNNQTPLHVAALGGHINVAKALLKGGADRNAKGRGGVTPLMTASNRGDGDMANLIGRPDGFGSLSSQFRAFRFPGT